MYGHSNKDTQQAKTHFITIDTGSLDHRHHHHHHHQQQQHHNQYQYHNNNNNNSDPFMSSFEQQQQQQQQNNPFGGSDHHHVKGFSPASPGSLPHTHKGLLSKEPTSRLSQIIDMGKCIAGIYASFMVMSVYQEKVTRRPYGIDERYFNFPLFLVFVQCLLNSVVAYVKMSFFPSEKRKSQVPIKFYAMASFAYVMAFVCSNAALVYVNYPTQVLAKSCKAIPVMALGVLIAKKRYPLSRYVAVLFLSIGISVFMLSRFSSKKKSTNYNDNNTYGLILLLVSLLSDGFTNALQSIMQSRESKPTADEMMLYMNTFAVFFVGVALLVSQQLVPAVSFCLEYPEINKDIIVFAICMAAGQIFIFWCIASYGPLVCSIVTTTRKFFTILFSVFWYGHEMGFWEWSGVTLVFLGLMYDIFSSLSSDKKKGAASKLK